MKVETLLLSENDWVPNNPHFAIVIYRQAIEPTTEAMASEFEKLFQKNRWPARWRDGIFRYHHYHSTAHEVLGVARGSARLLLGGPQGHELEIFAGDAVVLPAGTGHCLLEESSDFLVVGAYPPGQDFDICRTAPTTKMSESITHLKKPLSDPIAGPGGPLIDLWPQGGH